MKKFFLFITICVTGLLTAGISLFAQSDKARVDDSLKRVEMAELFNKDDKEGFLLACKDLVDFHAAQNNEKQLFDAYATLIDRLQVWGRFDEAVKTLDEMSEQAHKRGSDIGDAITEFCFGQFYLGNKQPVEALPHYKSAFEKLQKLGEDGRAIRAGFNLQAIAMNLNDIDGGLAINDSTERLILQFEQKRGKISFPNRMKQVRYRFVLLQRKGDLKRAALLKDTLLHYADIVNDPSQDELLFTALAQFEQQAGNKKKAYSYLDTLIERNLKLGNYLKVAQFRLALADFQKENGDLNLAVESYKAYSVASDSANVHLTNQQINELTKKYELNVLQSKQKTMKVRLTWVFFSASLLLAFSIIISIYSISLRSKNKLLYENAQKIIKEEENTEKNFISSPKLHQSSEEELFTSLLNLMNEKQLFRNPNINRDELSYMLGTNRTYLSKAIKECADTTISGFINHCRVRWAAEEIVRNPRLSITAISEDAGFASRSTFTRLFQNQYGMNPVSYRSLALKQKIS